MTQAETRIIEHPWPALELQDWKDTCDTLHMWTQIVGKVRLALAPHVNHWWQVALYVTPRGLTTSLIPYRGEAFEVLFDFTDHKLLIQTSWGAVRTVGLFPRSVADFYGEFMAALASLGIEVKIWSMPVEVPDPIRFEQDHVHASYDADATQRFWRILLKAGEIMTEFRSRFIGKCSPVHFFWGSFDLAVTRFSGRTAPPRSGADLITREAYSHEVSSAGFWPGGGSVTYAAFYSYAAPEPSGFAQAAIGPKQAFYHQTLHEFLLKYDDVRMSPSPRETLLEFLQSTYDAAASLGGWDSATLERRIDKGLGTCIDL